MRAYELTGDDFPFLPEDVLNYVGLRFRLGMLEPEDLVPLERTVDVDGKNESAFNLLSECYFELGLWVRLFVHLRSKESGLMSSRQTVLMAWAEGMTGMFSESVHRFAGVVANDLPVEAFNSFCEFADKASEGHSLLRWCKNEFEDLNVPLRFSIAKRLLITAIDERSFEQISNLLLQERMLFNESVGAVGLAVLTMAGREEASSAWALAAEFTLPHYQGWGESDWARFLHYCSDVQCQHDVRQVVDGVRQIGVRLPGFEGAVLERVDQIHERPLVVALSTDLLLRQRRLPSGVLEQDVISSEGIRDADDALVLGLVDWCDSADILTGISLLRAVELRDEDLIWRVGQSISRLSHGPSESHLVKVSSHLTDDWIKQIHRSETFAALVEIGVSVNAVSRALMTWLNECGSDRLVHFKYLPAFDDFCLDAFAELFEKLAKFSEHRELCATLLLKLVRGDRMPSM